MNTTFELFMVNMKGFGFEADSVNRASLKFKSVHDDHEQLKSAPHFLYLYPSTKSPFVYIAC